ICFSSSRRSGGRILMIDWPIISSAEYPKIRSAALFQLMTILRRFLLTMASSEESIMAPYNTSAGIELDFFLTVYSLIGSQRPVGRECDRKPHLPCDLERRVRRRRHTCLLEERTTEIRVGDQRSEDSAFR